MGRNDLYLLQVDISKLSDGLVYEAADDSNYFPHFYGPDTRPQLTVKSVRPCFHYEIKRGRGQYFLRFC
uniref:Uncharacterized protein n=1 Tax=Leersia perrieri TaxID=77586 RepID=A0A0D9VV28_9ORYZ